METKILTIDPGLTATGFCLFAVKKEKLVILELGTIRPKAKTFELKAEIISAELKEKQSDIVVIEEPSPNWTRYGKNHKSLMLLQQLITRIVLNLNDREIYFVNADEISKPRKRNYDDLQDIGVKKYLEKLGFKKTSRHARDAVRIGFHWWELYGAVKRIKGKIEDYVELYGL